jgi:lysophospholipase L1-like esterase
MKFQTTINLKNLCSALLLAAGAASLVGCDASTTEPPAGTGGNTVSVSGGSGSGGKVSATGGATSATGGATPATGGAIPATGGATPGTGGAIPATGGATPGTGGATPGTGGATPGTGGAGKGGAIGTGGGPAGTGGGAAGADGGRGGTSGTGGTTGKNDASATGGSGENTDAGAGGSGPLPDAAPVDPSKKITVWMVGDSTMQNCSGSGQCGWAAEFQQYFGPNATVSNQARGGRSIQTWIWGDPNVSKTATDANGECQVIDNTTYSDNLTTMLDATKGMKPGDWVYVAFGINDATAACNRHVGKALFQSDLDFMAKTIRSKGANPIFGTSTSGQSCSGSTNVANRGFGPETKAAGTADNVPVVDLTTLSVALYNSLKLCPGGSTTFWFDGTHFKTDGATQVAGVVAKAIKDQGIGLAAYLK